MQKTVNTFSSEGRIVLHELYNEGYLAEKTALEYDEKGRLAKEIREFDEGYPLSTVFKYDEEGRLIEKRMDDSDGELQLRQARGWRGQSLAAGTAAICEVLVNTLTTCNS